MRTAIALVLVGLLVLVALPGTSLSETRSVWKVPAPPPKPPEPLPPEKSLKKATVDGKYEMLLAQIEVEADVKTVGEFHDLGLKRRLQHGGHKNLPRGYWVYVYPYWYIWGGLSADAKPNRSWGPEQLLGEPNTPTAGDHGTAWASRTPDEQDEWLLLEYAEPAIPKAIEIHETYNPGAVVRVTAFKLDGTEVEVWKGKDPTAFESQIGVSVLEIKGTFKTNRVKVYIDSKNVPGWNEIDAVALRDGNDKVQWVAAAHTSTTYAAQENGTDGTRERIEQLEETVQDLQDEIKGLKDEIKELKELLKKKP